MDGKVFISRQGRNFSFVKIFVSVLLPSLYPELLCKHLGFPPRKS